MFGAEDQVRFWDGVSVRFNADMKLVPCLESERDAWIVPDSIRMVGLTWVADCYAPDVSTMDIAVTYSVRE